MKLIVFIILSSVNILYAQTNDDSASKNPDYNCKKTQNISFNKLVLNFPLNKTSKIQIVAFEYRNSIIIDGVEKKEFVIDSLPRIGNKLDYKNLKEFYSLELPKIIELSDILYNFNFNPKKERTILGAGCYMPRNAIVFLDKEDKIIEYIEICFECLNYHVFKKSNFGDFCIGKIELIKTFFRQNGLKFGVTEK